MNGNLVCPEIRLQHHSVHTGGNLGCDLTHIAPSLVKKKKKKTLALLKFATATLDSTAEHCTHASTPPVPSSSSQLEPARRSQPCRQAGFVSSAAAPPLSILGGLKREPVICLVLSPYGCQTQISTDNVKLTSQD